LPAKKAYIVGRRRNGISARRNTLAEGIDNSARSNSGAAASTKTAVFSS